MIEPRALWKQHISASYPWDGEAGKFYDAPGAGMFAPELFRPTIDRLAAC